MDSLWKWVSISIFRFSSPFRLVSKTNFSILSYHTQRFRCSLYLLLIFLPELVVSPFFSIVFFHFLLRLLQSTTPTTSHELDSLLRYFSWSTKVVTFEVLLLRLSWYFTVLKDFQFSDMFLTRVFNTHHHLNLVLKMQILDRHTKIETTTHLNPIFPTPRDSAIRNVSILLFISL